jgi:hypothetical protein
LDSEQPFNVLESGARAACGEILSWRAPPERE